MNTNEKVEKKNNLPLRLWRMSEKDFKEQLLPLVASWKQQNIDVLFSVVVKFEKQKDVAKKFKISPPAVNGILRRAYQNFSITRDRTKYFKKDNK